MIATKAGNLIAAFLLVIASAVHAQGSSGLIFSDSFEVCDNIEDAPDGAVFWDGGGDGTSWNDELNWKGDILPVENDDVSINVEGTVVIVVDIGSEILRLNSLDSCEPIQFNRGTLELVSTSRIRSDLEMMNGTIISTGDLFVHGYMTQMAGTVTGAGTIMVGRQLLWSGGNQGDAAYPGGTTVTSGGLVFSGASTRFFQARTLTLNGPSTWTNGGLYLRDGSTLNNNNTLDIQSDTNMGYYTGAESRLNNTGSITKTARTGVSRMDFDLYNDGTIALDSGELWLGRSTSVGTSTGDFVVNAGAKLGLGGSNTLSPGSTFTGAGGFIFLSGGTTVIKDDYDITGSLDVRGGTLEFLSNEDITGDVVVKTGTLRLAQGASITGDVTLTSGTLEFGTASSISGSLQQSNGTLIASGNLPVGGSYTQNAGTATGAGTITATGLFTWSGGAQGDATYPGGTTVADGGMVFSGTSTRFFQARILTLNGPSTWTTGGLYLRDGSTLNNNDTLDIQSDTNMGYYTGAESRLNNTGSITKTARTGVSRMDFDLYNSGTITVDSGELWLGRSTSVGTSTGNFVSNAGAKLGLGGSNTLSAGSAFSGAGGFIFLAGGTTVIHGNYDMAGSLDVRGGTLEFSSNENITSDVAVKTGTLRFTQGASITGDVAMASGTLEFGTASSISGSLQQSNGTLIASGNLPVGGSYTQNAGTATGAGTMTVTGLFTWSGGAQGDATYPGGTTVADGGMVFSGTSTRFFQARTLTLNGPSTWTNGGLYLRDGSTLNNNDTLDIQSDTNMGYYTGAESRLNNTGSITKTARTGVSRMDFDLYNSGTITVDSGELWLGRSTSVGTSTGDFVANAGAYLGLSGSNTMSAGSTFSGAGGFIFLAGGTTVIHSGYDMTGSLDVRGGELEFTNHKNIMGYVVVKTGTLRFAQGASVTGDVTMTSGMLEFGGASSISGNLQQSNGTLIASGNLPVGGSYTQNAGTATGAGTMTVTGLFTWSGGAQGDATYLGGTTVADGGMVFSGTSTRFFQARTLTLNGPSTWTNGGLYLRDGSTLNNNSTLDIQSDTNMGYYTGAESRLNNTGSITKTARTGVSRMDFDLYNSGTITVDSGELWLGRSTSVGTSTGDFVANAGAYLGLSGSNTMSAGSTFSGAGGFIFLAGGTTVISDDYDITGSLDVRGGTVEFSSNENIMGDVAVKTGTLRFAQGASITGDVTMTSGTLEFGTASSISGSLLQLNGTLIASGNLPVGVSYTQNAGTATGAGTMTVTGLFTWSGGAQGDATYPGGTTVADGGMVFSGTSTRFFQARTLTLNGPSTWTNGGLYLRDGSILNNNSTLDIQSDKTMSYYTGTVSIFNNNNILTKSSGSGLTTIGADFNNVGNVSVNNGELKFATQFIQAGTGNLAVRIDTGSFDSYVTTGAVTLDGVLEINLLNGFAPSVGSTFEIMTFASRTGEFFSVTGADIGNGTHFEVVYGSGSVDLEVVTD